MASMDKWAPSDKGIRDPRDPKKKAGMFHNPTRYLRFGGVAGAPMQAGDKGPSMKAADGQNANGPITDRGKGRR